LNFLVLFIELVVPVLIFCGRKPRQFACWVLILFQVCILLTGNYTFFNGLTILLCLTLLDDALLGRLLPQSFRNPPSRARGARWRWKFTVPLTVVVLVVTAVTLPLPAGMERIWPRPMLALYGWMEPFRSFNAYGLFADMTQTRPEIIIEGSTDGVSWQEYEFRYKPGGLKRAPAFVAPHQPRLDWQMWFAALGTVEQNHWFLALERRLLQNSPPVTALLAHNPFPEKPPKYIRAQLYQYHFTDAATRRATGQWWRRQYEGVYVPPLSLADFRPANSQ
jgi:hypothetical protein